LEQKRHCRERSGNVFLAAKAAIGPAPNVTGPLRAFAIDVRFTPKADMCSATSDVR